DQQVVLGYTPFTKWSLYGKAGIKVNIPDQINVRVPEKENVLPGPERKERVQRYIGPQGLIGITSDFKIIDTISFSAGYDVTEKTKDSYRGSKDWKYSILEKNTNSSAHRAKLGVSYDTTRAYFRKQAAIPALVSYEWNDTVAGRNIERQTVNELWVTVFF
ncbi:MAG: hypothetical protein AB7O96_19665, partial [Pseudobdellovibrionaceae bacterium]